MRLGMRLGMLRSFGLVTFGLVTFVLVSGCGDDDAAEDAATRDAETNDAQARDADSNDGEVRDADTSDADSSDGGTLGCGSATRYAVGDTSDDRLDHDGVTRTFRVHVPPSYDPTAPTPVVLMFHGGGGSGRQLETGSVMNAVADREGFVAVYPDGTGMIRTWNGEGCCGSAVRADVDDVGFVDALLDHLEAELCVDPDRVFASGMSNGAILSHRLACELSDRIAAIAPVAGTIMTSTCTPSRTVHVMHVHGTEDAHVPWEGGIGCGLAGVPFTSVPDTIEGWRTRNACEPTSARVFEQGNGTCEGYEACAEGGDVWLCAIDGGGHSWPSSPTHRDVIDCPADGELSTTFDASDAIWRFFSTRGR